MRASQIRTAAAAAALLGGVGVLSASAQNEPSPPGGTPAPTPPVKPEQVWPAGLKSLAGGRYVYAQVGSPGGLWERTIPAKGPLSHRQVSISEVPEPLRQKLTRAELTISLDGETRIEAEERMSPAKRGMLRFYTESGMGKLTLRNLPGIGGISGDTRDFSGPVLLELNHQLHSNPSVFGIFQQRQQQEMTWGAATIDFADLQAVSLPKEDPAKAPGAAGAGKAPGAGKPAAPKAGAPGVEPKENHDEHAEAETLIIANARVMRNGQEIFAFVEWTKKDKLAEKTYFGTIRLLRQSGDGAPVPAVPRPPMPPPARA
jgi:hypothetical protein